jgi:hypothetical protein
MGFQVVYVSPNADNGWADRTDSDAAADSMVYM